MKVNLQEELRPMLYQDWELLIVFLTPLVSQTENCYFLEPNMENWVKNQFSLALNAKNYNYISPGYVPDD